MSSYTPPSQWPIIRWVAFWLVFIPCWFFGLGAAKGFHILVEKPFGENIVTGLIQVVIYYGGCALVFIFVGIPVMGVIEGAYKYLTDAK